MQHLHNLLVDAILVGASALSERGIVRCITLSKFSGR